ncbi:Adaptor protein complex AP-3 delta subunit [Aspergillus sclerotioniger CBS 115572]|uniref:AP-3 complex subunit delta n=1 Tax=Aspergillus sclerotioniger CBS 115572 TaxID=1450535 RepID=A0A317VS34_9EURO|nr:Adaptor protein complex AP-3 delta subunit [Aspergillus sclerotioniger CBS 115572]PWY77146.1 Adaptor protein complex AP-3 delta subunit [Aspergillus sclerotioniger CBS 115572]
MFEKSLYDLIKGLRNHRGTEDEYIQDSLRECKAEIKSQDMDKKATALLKLVYLEMFGYDMSWASFHVLEVMSSAKYLQKRAGYLGAEQSFRPDTEVLMLATNLLKKDLVSHSIPNMSLPLITLPTIATTSLAMSLLPDVLSRISHSHAVVRKKAVICLYRLTLAYPDALKLAWPKIKERLMDDEEDTSVTTAVLNVVCELGWRRPHDFLPLAPRFFELLVDGGNNWMAIKIIKLFATLTPLEPRLVRKLHRPLVNIIQTTTAMSLLYECINGLIQGGILDGEAGIEEKDEIANLCVGKLRGMVVSDSDPNLKYVALLAFNRIVVTYPALVSMHQDVIMYCLDDADISIRLQALELATRMVTSDTLQSIVSQLISQLTNSRPLQKGRHLEIEDGRFEWGDYELRKDATNKAPFALPSDYQAQVLHRIIDICSFDNYSNLSDFEWYVDVLIRLVKLLPADIEDTSFLHAPHYERETQDGNHITGRIGSEIRNIAVRVRDVRMEATRAAESLILIDNRQALHSGVPASSNSYLGPLAWVVGEYAGYLVSPGQTLHSLIDLSNVSLPGQTLSLYVQAIPKVFIHIVRDSDQQWGSSRRSEIALILVRATEFLEALGSHPDLDVQERAIEFLEIMRLAADAARSTGLGSCDAPFLLASVIPSLFDGLELNPVSVNAQKKVQSPELLRLQQAFNNGLWELFDHNPGHSLVESKLPFHDFYYNREASVLDKQVVECVSDDMHLTSAFRNTGNDLEDSAASVKRKVDQKERSRDDPFYIGADDTWTGISQTHRLPLHVSNDGELDIDSIPIIDLRLNETRDQRSERIPAPIPSENRSRVGSHLKKYHVIPDEMIGHEGMDTEDTGTLIKSSRSLLLVDSSGLQRLSLREDNMSPPTPKNVAGVEEDVEMAKAMRQVEKVRLEMQRESERVHPTGIPSEGTLVKKKKRVKKVLVTGTRENEEKQLSTADGNGQRKPKKKRGRKQ